MELRKIRAMVCQVSRYFGNFYRSSIRLQEGLMPFMGVYYLNYECNAHCSFCSRRAEISQLSYPANSVSPERVREIMMMIRRWTPSLYFNGGEPTLEENIEEYCRIAREELQFYPVVINTNAILLDTKPDILRYADRVVVSMHATNPERVAEIYQVSKDSAEKSLRNIEKASADIRKLGNQLTVNLVLTPQNVKKEAWEVLEFCLQHRIRLAVVPAIVGYQPLLKKTSAEIRQAYTNFVNRLLEVKTENPISIQGTKAYLRQIRDLLPFQCRPSGMLSIDPRGNVINSCVYKFPDKDRNVGRLDEITTANQYREMIPNYQQQFMPCLGNCLKMAYAEAAMVLANPWQGIREYSGR